MENFNNLKFSAWNEGGRCMCSLVGDIPGSKLGYISFYFTADEFRDFANGAKNTFNDIGHNLYSFIDSCIFYDLTFPSDAHGVAQIPFIRADIPLFVRRVLLRWAEKQWKVESNERTQVMISSERSKRWTKLYGLGSGQAKLKMNDTTRRFFEELLCNDNTKNEHNLQSRIDQLLTIARNGTYAFFQVGYVDLAKDWDGFYFRILNPRGKCSMNGGVVNHGRDGADYWSLHT